MREFLRETPAVATLSVALEVMGIGRGTIQMYLYRSDPLMPCAPERRQCRG